MCVLFVGAPHWLTFSQCTDQLQPPPSCQFPFPHVLSSPTQASEYLSHLFFCVLTSPKPSVGGLLFFSTSRPVPPTPSSAELSHAGLLSFRVQHRRSLRGLMTHHLHAHWQSTNLTTRRLRLLWGFEYVSLLPPPPFVLYALP